GARDPRVRARRPRRLHRRRAARRRPHRRDPQGVIPDKRLGQHFLTDRSILQRIADALEPAPDDVVVEIGAGKGSLTDELLARGLRVIAIEKDRRLAAELGTRNAERGTDRLTVVHGDALRLDWQAMVVPPSAFRVPHFKVIGNIPYAITSPLIDKALTPPLPACIVFLVQAEVADRVAWRPDSRRSGSIPWRVPRRSVRTGSCGSCVGALDCEIIHNMRKISESTVRRLSLYLRFLEQFDAQGQTTISSAELARRGGTTSAQVRKDLSFFGSFGKRGLGYSVPELTARIRDILGLRRTYRVVLVGAGRIGSALVQYPGFRQRGFHVAAIYDKDPKKIGSRWNGLVVRDVRHLDADFAKEPSDIAIVVTPAESAQEVVDRLVRAG